MGTNYNIYRKLIIRASTRLCLSMHIKIDDVNVIFVLYLLASLIKDSCHFPLEFCRKFLSSRTQLLSTVVDLLHCASKSFLPPLSKLFRFSFFFLLDAVIYVTLISYAQIAALINSLGTEFTCIKILQFFQALLFFLQEFFPSFFLFCYLLLSLFFFQLLLLLLPAIIVITRRGIRWLK